MQSASHTPGPLQVYEQHDSQRPDDEGMWAIGTGPVSRFTKLGEATEKADALLWAAAPDLLARLSEVLHLAELKWGNLDADANTIFANARAALAKATGESR